MNRRQYLTLSGVAVAGVAGCVGDTDDGDDDQSDGGHADAYDADVDEGERNGTDENGYAIYEVNGVGVPLAPTSEVIDWYESEDVLPVDARSESAYDQLRIDGAVWSPAPDGQGSGDPLGAVATTQRIVTYCVCPHTLAGSRASVLIQEGYENVYALDEGLEEWFEQGYPVKGTNV